METDYQIPPKSPKRAKKKKGASTKRWSIPSRDKVKQFFVFFNEFKGEGEQNSGEVVFEVEDDIQKGSQNEIEEKKRARR